MDEFLKPCLPRVLPGFPSLPARFLVAPAIEMLIKFPVRENPNLYVVRR